MCNLCVFSNQNVWCLHQWALLTSYGGQLRAMAVAYIVLGVSGVYPLRERKLMPLSEILIYFLYLLGESVFRNVG